MLLIKSISLSALPFVWERCALHALGVIQGLQPGLRKWGSIWAFCFHRFPCQCRCIRSSRCGFAWTDVVS